MTAVSSLWSAAWTLLCASFPDAESRLARLPHAGKVARLEASAARRGARVVRGELPLSDFVARLREWENAAADALARQDDSASRQLCGDCGSRDEHATLTGLGNVVCRRCLRLPEATP